VIWKAGLKKFGIWAAASKRRKPESELQKMTVPSLPLCLQTAFQLNTPHDCTCARPRLLLLFYFNADSAIIGDDHYSFIQPRNFGKTRSGG